MNDQPSAKTFWQWILIYLGSLLSLLFVYPTFRDVAVAIYEDITVSELIDGRRQSQLWSANIDCLAEPIVERKSTPEKFDIGAAVCPTGDVLAYIRSPEAKEFYRWIPLKTASSHSRTLSTGLVGEADAGERRPLVLAQTAQRVICQRASGGKQLMRRSGTDTTCSDEFIDMTTGRVLRRLSADCAASC